MVARISLIVAFLFVCLDAWLCVLFCMHTAAEIEGEC